ncbi:Uncharacterised protein [Salmonella enterica subsp. enterica serovar Typhi]|nr:Uncharacterised protein [Salmonella enterica subsp. enterica serovar Typhi]CIA11702.1 Uncharacterised protein [Salmonella enterica subsp. enterica serovar Typhi]CIL97601.1 Uncharacterised protein [Salmonella enterica subsp. enterica serovar Typhi]
MRCFAGNVEGEFLLRLIPNGTVISNIEHSFRWIFLSITTKCGGFATPGKSTDNQTFALPCDDSSLFRSISVGHNRAPDKSILLILRTRQTVIQCNL